MRREVVKYVSSLRWRGRAGGDSHGASRHRGQDNVVSARLCTRGENPEANAKQTREQKAKTRTPDRTARARQGPAPRDDPSGPNRNGCGVIAAAATAERIVVREELLGVPAAATRLREHAGLGRLRRWFFLNAREMEVTRLEGFANAWPTRACALPSEFPPMGSYPAVLLSSLKCIPSSKIRSKAQDDLGVRHGQTAPRR